MRIATSTPYLQHRLHRGLEIGHDTGSLGACVGERMAEVRGSGGLAVEAAEEIQEEARLARLARGVVKAAAVFNGAVAVTAAYEGFHLLHSPRGETRVEGANCLLMGAGCGLLAAQLALGHSPLGQIGSGLLITHGLVEIGLGAWQVAGPQGEQHQRWLGVTKIAHGACLAAAELCPSLSLPLYLGMAGATVAGLCLQGQEGVKTPC